MCFCNISFYEKKTLEFLKLQSLFCSLYFASRYALIFSTNKSLSIPCTIAASSRVSPCADGHQRQCIPISIRIGATSGFVNISSPIVIVFVTCAIMTPPFFSSVLLIISAFFHCVNILIKFPPKI